ncbi:ricin-type beta-trefoil lectin domain protein [Streptomyces shenzhenensis]
MGESTRKDGDGPRILGFARSFAANSRNSDSGEKPSGLSRATTAVLTVAVLSAATVGVGTLVSYSHRSGTKEEAAQSTAPNTPQPNLAGATKSPSPKAAEAGRKTAQEDLKAGGHGNTDSHLPSSAEGPSGSGGADTSGGSGAPGGTAKSAASASGGSSGSTKKSSGSGGSAAGDTSTRPQAATYSIVSAASGRCIDITDSGKADGTPLQIWDCTGAGWQRWTFASDGTLRSQGLCMDVAWGSRDNGAAIQLAKCSGNPAQQFRLNAAGDLVNPQADKCVDSKDQGTANGTRLQLWECGGTANQKWSRR